MNFFFSLLLPSGRPTKAPFSKLSLGPTLFTFILIERFLISTEVG